MGLRVADIPQDWRNTLASIQTQVPEAFLGGGALRDLDNGLTPKDLDVFIPVPNDYMAFASAVSRSGYLFSREVTKAYLGGDPSVVGSLEFYHREGSQPPLNVITLLDRYVLPESLDRFDFGICQVAYDGRRIVTTEAYERDCSCRTLTVCRADDLRQLERTLHRYERLSKKFPEHVLVVPPEYDHRNLLGC